MLKLIQQQYEVMRQLGSGSFALTYLVKDLHRPEQKKAVLKLLKPLYTDDSFRALARTLFSREVQILEKLGPTKLAPSLLATFETDRQIGLVESFIEGVSLHSQFHQGLVWSEMLLIPFLESALSTLALLHGSGFVHRDLNPAHWIQPAGNHLPVLIDFNSALPIYPLEAASTKHSRYIPTLETAFVIGTPGYMAPEQRQGQADVRSDLYTLGLIAVQGMTGQSPTQLSRNTQGEIRWQPLNPIRIELVDILTRLVRYRPQDRYLSAAEALQDMQEYVQPHWSHVLTKWWEPKHTLAATF